MPDREPHHEKPYWLDAPENVRRIVYALYALSALFALIDLVVPRESQFPFEAWPGFFAGFGFLACVVLVLAAKAMRRLLMRREHYYD
jgi:hypothetical protein